LLADVLLSNNKSDFSLSFKEPIEESSQMHEADELGQWALPMSVLFTAL